MISFEKFNLVAASQDIGGCQALAPVVEYLRQQKVKVNWYSIPARISYFQKKNIRVQILDPSSEKQVKTVLQFQKPNVVLLGTSLGPSLEHHFIVECRKKGIPTVAFLDSWVLYAERFTDPETGEKFKYLPDRICVTDTAAREEMIEEGFSPEMIYVTGNPYLDQLAERNNHIDRTETRNNFLKQKGLLSETRILSFLSQPIDTTFSNPTWNHRQLGYTQWQVLEMIMAALKKISVDSEKPFVLIVRPHPKEAASRYQTWLGQAYPFPMIVEEQMDLHDLLGISDCVLGMFSTSLVEAYLMDKSVISLHPHGTNPSPFILCRRDLVPCCRNVDDLFSHLRNFNPSKLLKNLPPFSLHESAEKMIHLLKEYRYVAHSATA